MVGDTGIEPVTPTMSMLQECADISSRPALIKREIGNLGSDQLINFIDELTQMHGL